MMRFRLYQDVRGEWRWRLVATNGRVMADSAEGYVRRAGAVDALRTIINAIVTGAATLDDDELPVEGMPTA